MVRLIRTPKRWAIGLGIIGVIGGSVLLVAAQHQTTPVVSSAPLLSASLNTGGEQVLPASAAPSTLPTALDLGKPAFSRADAQRYALSLPYASTAQTISVHYRLWTSPDAMFSSKVKTEDPAFANMLTTHKGVEDLPVWILQYYNAIAGIPNLGTHAHVTAFVFVDAHDGAALGTLLEGDAQARG
jgi:hypothetical protein